MHEPFKKAIRDDPALTHAAVAHDPFHIIKRRSSGTPTTDGGARSIPTGSWDVDALILSGDGVENSERCGAGFTLYLDGEGTPPRAILSGEGVREELALERDGNRFVATTGGYRLPDVSHCEGSNEGYLPAYLLATL
jgi:hypothetical protein